MTKKNGNIVLFKIVDSSEDLIIITNSGIIIRIGIEQVSVTGRVAQVVRLIKLKNNQLASNVTIMKKSRKRRKINRRI